MKSIFQEKARVLNNTRMGAAYGRISLKCSLRYLSAKPGQFVTVQTDSATGPLLRRPFSIHRLNPLKQGALCLEILYKIVGPATGQMARLRPGDRVDILGPLGNGFSMENGLKRVVLAGGGIGIAPLLFLASVLHTMEKNPAEVTVFAGGRSESDLLCLGEFADLGITVYISTDDGSAGEKGVLTRPLEAAIQEQRPDMIYACGPMEMLTCVAGIAKNQGVPCQVSIETIMACGMGACLGCAIEGASPDASYLHVCLDGPVFDARRLSRQPGI